MLIENGKFVNYCLKFNESNENGNNEKKLQSLVLENCYYCILFNLEKCSFNYESTDKIGHLFYFYKKEIKLPYRFYLKNNYEINKAAKEKIESYSKTLKSFSDDRVDYSAELEDLQTNSTLSSEYVLRNILSQNQYWASELYKKPNCENVELKVIRKF